ncbi:MAG: peptidoglycan-binding domain-containing protein [Pseudomonadota bacterium]
MIEETRRRVLVQQASVSTDGKTRYPARYRDEVTRTEISPRSSFWVEIPCKGKLIPDHIAALQRGLAVRGFFEGPITGRYDSATQEAVLRFQRTFDLNSDILSLKAATQLGLVQV